MGMSAAAVSGEKRAREDRAGEVLTPKIADPYVELGGMGGIVVGAHAVGATPVDRARRARRLGYEASDVIECELDHRRMEWRQWEPAVETPPAVEAAVMAEDMEQLEHTVGAVWEEAEEEVSGGV